MSDQAAWMHSIDGKYSAKTGYRFWYDHVINMHTAVQTPGWNQLWRTKIPHKVKIFLWRLCRNNIPVRNLLRGKGVRSTIMCPMCGSDIEQLLHIFFYCEYAQRC